MFFEPINFVHKLGNMGIGMLGVFIIIGVIIGATYAIGKFTAVKSNKDQQEDTK